MTPHLLRPLKPSGFTVGRGLRELGTAVDRLAAGLRQCCRETECRGLKLYADQARRHLENARKDFDKASIVHASEDGPNTAAAAAAVLDVGTRLELGMSSSVRLSMPSFGIFLLGLQREIDEIHSTLSCEPQNATMALAQEKLNLNNDWQDVCNVLNPRSTR